VSWRSLLCAVVVLSLAGWRSGHAAAGSTSDNDARGPSGLAEVVVTANKRTESIQDVPASVMALTSETLERANVYSFDDLVNVVPNVTISKTTQPANNSINIRGIGTYAYSIATQPATVVIVDDIPQSFQAQAFTSLADVQQVEVLRGPQTTLLGKSSTAGAINITTQRPSDTFTALMNLMATSDDEQLIRATVSGPISDTLGFRISAGYDDFKGSLHNLTTGSWVDGHSDETFRGKLVWQPQGGWDITLTSYMIDTIGSCCTGAPAFVSPGVTFSKSNLPVSLIQQGITPSPTNKWIRNDVDPKGNAYEIGSGLKVVRSFDSGLSVASISSYDHYTLHNTQDTDGTSYDFSLIAPGAPQGGSANGGYFTVNGVTQELRLLSPSTGSLTYLAGAYFSHADTKYDFVRGSNELGPYNGYSYNGLPQLPTSNSTLYTSYLEHAGIKVEALFGQARYALTDRLSLVGGIRLHHEQIWYDFWDRKNDVHYGTPACSTRSPTVPISTCNSDTVTTQKGAIEYHLTPDSMLFADYATGYTGLAYDLTSSLTTRTPNSSGAYKGIPQGDAIAARQPVRAEKSRNYEVGFKGTFLEHRLTWNVTGFYEELTGFQVQSVDTLTNVSELVSIGKVSTSGVESELATRLIPQLTFNLNASYDVAKMVDFPFAPCFGFQTAAQGCVNGGQDLSGRPLPNAPKWTANLSSEYDMTLGDGYEGFVAVTYNWRSHVKYNLNQDPDSFQAAYGLFNLSTGLGGKHWKATLFVNNLFDTHYAINRGRSGAYNVNPAGTPYTNAVNWTPGRDSFRYEGIRFSIFY